MKRAAYVATRLVCKLLRAPLRQGNTPLTDLAMCILSLLPKQAMHISVTTLKRLCRRHGVKRWPHRQISGINKALSDLEAQHEVAEGEEMLTVTEQLRQLHRRREVIIEVRLEFYFTDNVAVPASGWLRALINTGWLELVRGVLVVSRID